MLTFKKSVIAFISMLVLYPANSQNTHVTVYNNNIGIIKESRTIDLQKGINTVRITNIPERIKPATVHINLNGAILEQNYQYDLASLQKILSRYIDKEITLIGKDNTISGELISVSNNQIVLRNSTGGLIMLPDIEEYQINVTNLPEGFITRPTLVWKVEADRSGNQEAELTYQTSGMSWAAEYVAVLNESDTKLDLNSWVSLSNNSGATFKDAALKLVAGDVNVVEEEQQAYYEKVARAYDLSESYPQQFEERGFFEYHIYDLQRRTDLANNETKQISLFEAENISVKKDYLFRSGGMFPRGNDNQAQNVDIVVTFENTEKNNLGMPLPKGVVRVYKEDGQSSVLVGEDRIKHTAKNEEIKLSIGKAFDVLAEKKFVNQRRISDKVHENTIEVEIRNQKDENIEVIVEENLGLNWEILNSNIKYEKTDANTVEFKVPVKSEDKNTLKYTIRYSY